MRERPQLSDRDQLVADVAAAFVAYCRDRPWLELSPEQVAGIVVDIVLKRITVLDEDGTPPWIQRLAADEAAYRRRNQ